jgi:hypothetical protein
VGAKALSEQVEAFKARGVLKEELLQEMWGGVVAPGARESVAELLADCQIVTSFSDPDEPQSVSLVVPAHIVPQDVKFASALASCLPRVSSTDSAPPPMALSTVCCVLFATS